MTYAFNCKNDNNNRGEKEINKLGKQTNTKQENKGKINLFS